MTDIASAARRVAEDTRQGNRPLPDDMLALLPVLDAVAAGQDDAGRLERWARALDPIWFAGYPDEAGCANYPGHSRHYRDLARKNARAAIALADAERAAEAATRLRPMKDAPRTGGTEFLVYDDHGYVSLVHRTLYPGGWTCSNMGDLGYGFDREVVHVGDEGPYDDDGDPKAIGWLPVREHPGSAIAREEVAVLDAAVRRLAGVSKHENTDG